MDYNDFAQKIKDKYPQYSSVDNRELASKMIDKFPEYKAQVNLNSGSTPGGFLGKTADFIGGGKLAQGLGVAASNLMGGQDIVQEGQANVAKLQGDIASKIAEKRARGEDVSQLEKALSEGQKTQEFTANNVQDVGTQNLANKEVLGSAAQLGTNIAATALPGASSLVEGAGIVPTLGKVGASAAMGSVLGAASGATKSLAENNDMGQVASDAKKSAITGAIFGGLTQGVSEGYKALGNMLSKAGDKITMSVIKPSQADIKDGFNVLNVKKYGLDGSLDTTLQKTNDKMRELSGQLNAKLADSPEKINLDDVYKKTMSELQGSKLKQFGSNTKTGSALNELDKEIKLLSSDGGANVSIPDAQVVKQASGAQGAWQFGKSDPESTARENVYNSFYRNLKNEIEQKSPEGVRDINKQLGELIPIRNAVIRRIPVAERNNALGLGEIISLSNGLTNPSALALSGVTLASKSGQAGKILSTVGSGITGNSAIAGITGNVAKNLTAPLAAKISTKE